MRSHLMIYLMKGMKFDVDVVAVVEDTAVEGIVEEIGQDNEVVNIVAGVDMLADIEVGMIDIVVRVVAVDTVVHIVVDVVAAGTDYN